MAIPFWVINLSQWRLDAMEARWNSPLTQAQLANPWQQVRLDGSALLGLWNFKKVKRKLKAQANKKSGADGGSATIRGLVNPNFELDGELYIPSHLEGWIKVVQDLDVVGNPSAREQHTIEHPLASLSGVRNIIALDFEYVAPERGGPLKIVLGVLGVNARDGAAVTPKAKPVPTASTAPQVSIPAGQSAPDFGRFIREPNPGR